MRFNPKNLKIAHRLALAALSFAIPVLFILWSLVSEQSIEIDFTAKEVDGARYLGELTAIEAAEASLFLSGGDGAQLAERLKTAELRWGGRMHSAVMSHLAVAEFKKPKNLTSARARLRILIVRVGDASNLQLDNGLTTYYLVDVVLNRVPDVSDLLTDITHDPPPPIGDKAGRIGQWMGLGKLVGEIDGMDAALRTTEAAPGGEHIMALLDKDYFKLSRSLRHFVSDCKTADPAVQTTQRLIEQTGAFAARANAELHALLAARLAELRANRARELAVTACLFCVSIVLVLGVVVRGVTRPLERLIAATMRMAGGDLETEIAAGTAQNEIGEMKRALGVFRLQLRRGRDMEATREQEAKLVLRAKTDFLATMSHEIRSPMSGLIGVVEMLRGTALDAEQSRMAEMAHNSANMLLAVLNDILDFSKIEAGAMSVEQEPTALRKLLGEIVEPNAIVAARKNLRVALSVAADVPDRIRTDPLRLRQIIGNLLSNAIKFTAAGEVSVEVSWVNETAGPRLHCLVSDSGIGMTGDVLARLFNPFVQADGSTTRKFGGTGLGLSISAKLAGLLGGSISATSRPGLGSIFTLSLPLVVEPTARQEAAAEKAETRTAFEGRILVADDDDTIRWLLQRQLEKLGVCVDAATNGAAALEMLRAGAYDALLTDCHMPLMDGVALTRAVRQADDPTLKSLPIVGLTADVTEAERARCLAAGMSDIAIKPVSIDRLVQIVAALLPRGESAPAARKLTPTAETDPVFDAETYLSIFERDDPAGAEWLAGFLAEAHRGEAELQRVTEAAEANAGLCETVAKMAHRLAGASLTAGATRLGSAARRLERAAMADEAPALRGLAADIRKRLTEAEDAIDRFLRQKEGLLS